jgi:coenzyme F420-0:L-glutamate ligase/coenzyme F420-1:gamma-L-glutamate ligase
VIEIRPLLGIPEVKSGDDLAMLIHDAAGDGGLIDNDIVVVTHKIVSKAEGSVATIVDEHQYRALVEDQAAAVLRRRGDLVITETRHGFVCANAGVDRSNAVPGTAVLLPEDPDRSAHAIRLKLERLGDARLGVIVTDTFGRAWRRGLVDVAIGISGATSVLDLKGKADAMGREMEVTEIAVADEIAAAADLAMGKATAIPAAVVRGLQLGENGRGTDLIRDPSEDLFR